LVSQAALQATYLQEFHKEYANVEPLMSVYDGQKELERLLEVADIIDELKMIQHLIETQRDVLKSVISALINLNPSSESKNPPAQIHVNRCHFSSGGSLVINNTSKDSLDNVETTKALAQGIGGIARENVILMEETLVTVLTQLSDISKNAEYTQKMV
jgi:hypothetical protein